MTGPDRKRTFYKGREGRNNYSEKDEKKTINDEYADSPIVKAFERYSAELLAKHDKHERLVKYSRDVTIASKRAITAIHALMRSSNLEADKSKIIESLKNIENNLLKVIAKEVANDDQHQFIKAYTWGLQEYIEAVTFFEFVCSGNLMNYNDIVKKLTFEEQIAEGTGEAGDAPSSETRETFKLEVPVMDYILGVHDLTGELMRYCINSFASNQLSIGHATCDFAKRVYTGTVILSLIPNEKEHSKKSYVTRQSLGKMEMACYATRVRASEALPFKPDVEPDFSSESYSFYDG